MNKRSAIGAASWLSAAAAAAAALYVLQDTGRAAWSGYLRAAVSGHLTQLCSYLASPRTWRGLCSFLWERFEDHRQPLSKLALLADLAVSHGRGTVPFACEWSSQAFSALCWAAIYNRTQRDWRARTAFASLLIACVFSARQWENLFIPFLAAWPAVLACGCAAIALQLAASRRDDLTLAACAVLCAALATGWLIPGILVWPVLVAVAVLEKTSRRLLRLTVAAAALSAAVYFKGYAFARWHSVNPLSYALKPQLVLGFVGVALTAPLMRWPLAAGARYACAGAGALACVAAALALHARDRRQGLDPAASFFAYALAYLVVVLLAAALGRVQLGLEMALSARYQSLILLTWAALAASAASWLTPRLPPAWRPLAMPALSLAVIASLILPRQAGFIRFSRARVEEMNRLALTLALGIDDRLATEMNVDPECASAVVPVLRARWLLMFSDPLVASLGRPLRPLFHLREGACSGSFDRLEPIPLPGSPAEIAGRVIGTGREVGRSDGVRSVLVVDRRGEIVGAALGDFNASPRAWSGYARARRARLPLKAYAVLAAGDEACFLGVLPPRDHGT